MCAPFSYYSPILLFSHSRCMKPSLVIAGLGNPGSSYERTRHNVGFQAADVLAAACGKSPWREHQKFQALVQEARIVTVPVLLVKPLTYMNRSGESLRKIMDFYKLTAAQQLLVLCDDIDLPLGTVRLRRLGGPGTHNGLKSVVEQFGEGFVRLRIGLGVPPAGSDLAAWVLSVPPLPEQEELTRVLQSLPETVRSFVLDDAGAEG